MPLLLIFFLMLVVVYGLYFRGVLVKWEEVSGTGYLVQDALYLVLHRKIVRGDTAPQESSTRSTTVTDVFGYVGVTTTAHFVRPLPDGSSGYVTAVQTAAEARKRALAACINSAVANDADCGPMQLVNGRWQLMGFTAQDAAKLIGQRIALVVRRDGNPFRVWSNGHDPVILTVTVTSAQMGSVTVTPVVPPRNYTSAGYAHAGTTRLTSFTVDLSKVLWWAPLPEVR